MRYYVRPDISNSSGKEKVNILFAEEKMLEYFARKGIMSIACNDDEISSATHSDKCRFLHWITPKKILREERKCILAPLVCRSCGRLRHYRGSPFEDSA